MLVPFVWSSVYKPQELADAGVAVRVNIPVFGKLNPAKLACNPSKPLKPCAGPRRKVPGASEAKSNESGPGKSTVWVTGVKIKGTSNVMLSDVATGVGDGVTAMVFAAVD